MPEEEVASRGLVATGAVKVLGHLWEQLAPRHLERLECDGLVRRCAPGLCPNARAYMKPKSFEKCSLIVDPRNVNELCAETWGSP